MTDVRDTKVSSPVDQMPVRIWRATFAQDIDDETDEAQLILPDFDPNLTWGPANWRAMPHDSLPQEGDEALVVFDNAMQPWVATWWSGRPWAPQMGDWPGSYPIVATDIASEAITMPKLAPDVVAAIGSGGSGGWTGSYPIVAADIAANAVTTPKIQDGAVTNAKLAGSIDVAKLAPGTEGYTLKVVSGVAAWAVSPTSYPGTYPIVNADVAAGAAIAKTKLASLAIVNADVAAGAAIAVNKLAAGTNTHVLTTVAGVPTWTAPGAASVPDPLVLTSDITARNTAVTQVKIGAFGPAGEAAIVFGTVAPLSIYKFSATQLRTAGGFEVGGSVGAGSLFATDSIGVNQSDLTPGGGQGAIFFGGSWDTHLSRRTGGAISPWLYSNRAINAPDAVLGGPWQDIRWYGAVPGATTTGQYTANQTAIQAAFTAAGAVGGTVFIPYGLWKYTGPIVCPSNIRVVGVKGRSTDQAHGSILTQTGGGNLLTMSGCVDVEFEHVQLWNQGAHGIYTSGGNFVANVTFTSVQFTNWGSGHMIYLNTSAGQGNERIFWDNCNFSGGGVNQYFVASIGPDFFDKMNFTETTFEDFQGYAIYSTSSAVRSFRMAGCVTHGLISTGCRGTLYMSGITAGHGIEIERQYTEGSADQGVTAQVTQQGDFVFQGSSIRVTFISGHLNSASGNPNPVCTYAVNISGSGANALYLVNASYAGAIRDPSNILYMDSPVGSAALTLGSGWSTYAAPTPGSRRLPDCTVELSGRLQRATGAASGTVVATIADTSHRPQTNYVNPITAIHDGTNYYPAEFIIGTNGQITCYWSAAVTARYIFFDGQRFSINRP